MREYGFVVTTFEGASESITVEAECRVLGFSLAAKRFVDSNNVQTVRLVSDGGRAIGLRDGDAYIEDVEHRSSVAFTEGNLYRLYRCKLMTFGRAEFEEDGEASGRPNAFTGAALESMTGDDIMEVSLYHVISPYGLEEKRGYDFVIEEGLPYYFREGERHGGIVFDLGDEVVDNQYWYNRS